MKKTNIFNRRGCDYIVIKEVCSTWRPIGVWHLSTPRESIRRCPLSYSSRSTLMTHTDRSSSACIKSNTSKQSSEEASSWHAAVLPSLRLPPKIWYLIPEIRILPGEPLQKICILPSGMRFLPVDPPRNAIGLVFWVAIGRVLLWKPATVACYTLECLKAYERSLLQNGTWKLLEQ